MQWIFWTILFLAYLVPLSHFFVNGLRQMTALFRGQSFEIGALSELGFFLGKKPKFQTRLIDALGGFEYYFQAFRYYVIGTLLIGLLAYFVLQSIFDSTHTVSIHTVFTLMFFLYLNAWSGRQVENTKVKFTEFLRLYPRIRPEIFFKLFKRDLFLGEVILNQRWLPDHFIDPSCTDYRKKERGKINKTAIYSFFFDTAYLSEMVLVANKILGKAYTRSVSDTLGAMWGKRALQVSNSHFVLRDFERIENLKGPVLFLMNHKSSLDFILTYYALSETRFCLRKPKPRFLVAKDHFRDNPIIYHLMGLGKTIEAMDMVFLERKKKGQAFEQLKEASHAMLDKNIDLAVFPQGTRSPGNLDRVGKRRDSGYYTTLSPTHLKSDLPHIKIGPAYLIASILESLKERQIEEPLNLVFFGINGVGKTLPKGTTALLTETTIEMSVGDVVQISSDDLQNLDDELSSEKAVHDLHELIDAKLKQAISWHEQLKRRYLTDLKGCFRFEDDKILNIAACLDQISKETPIAYRILDCIYALPIQDWNGYLSQLTQLLQGKMEMERFQALFLDVAEHLLKKAG